MRGFIRKELYLMDRLYRKNILLILVLYTAISVASKVDFLWYALVCILCFYSLAGITLDETSGWDTFARAMPVSPARVVAGKYAAALIVMGLGVAFALIAGVGTKLYAHESAGEYLYGLAMVVCIALINMGVLRYCVTRCA